MTKNWFWVATNLITITFECPLGLGKAFLIPKYKTGFCPAACYGWLWTHTLNGKEVKKVGQLPDTVCPLRFLSPLCCCTSSTGNYPQQIQVQIYLLVFTPVFMKRPQWCLACQWWSILLGTVVETLSKFGGRWDRLLIKDPFMKWLGPRRPLNHPKLTMDSSLPHRGPLTSLPLGYS